MQGYFYDSQNVGIKHRKYNLEHKNWNLSNFNTPVTKHLQMLFALAVY